MLEITESSEKDAKIIGKLKKGDKILAGNQPIGGLYKIKTEDGQFGWVSAEGLTLEPTPEASKSPATSPSPSPSPLPTPTPSSTPSVVPSPASSSKKLERRFQLRGFGTGSFVSLSGVVVNYNRSDLGFSYGGEFAYSLSSRFALVLRGEAQFVNSAFTDSLTAKNYAVNVSSWPVYLGIEYALLQGSQWSLWGVGMGGMGFQTTLVSTSLSDAAPNTAGVSTMPLSGLGKLVLKWKVSKPFSLFAEAGYRYLQSGVLVPSTTLTGGAILYPAFALNLGGPFTGLGFGWSF